MPGSDSINVLLISANSETSPAPVYPLALAKLAGALRRAGYTARQFDVLVHGRAALPAVLGEARPLLVGVSMRNVDNIHSGGPRSYIEECRTLIGLVRGHSAAPVVVGGSGFSLFPRELMRVLDADFGVAGAGENALGALVGALQNGQVFQSIPGLLWKGGAAARAEAGVPLRAAALHDPEILRHYWANGGMIGLQTKRGCPRACSYCTYPLIDGSEVSAAEPAALVDEIERMVKDHGVNYVFMVDSIFNLRREHEVLFAEELCRRALGVSWCAFFRPCHIDRSYLELLKRSGLTHMEFGTDSLSEQMLRNYRKGFTVDQVCAASRLSAEAGLFQAHYLLLGGPGETVATIRETVNNAAKLSNAVFLPFVGLRVYPGTGLHRTAVERAIVAPHADCLAPTFYVEPDLKAETVWELVAKRPESPNRWILPSALGAMQAVMNRMRQRGMKGPLWEYAP